MELKKPRAILFDWDNTLVNTWPTIHEALNKTLSELGMEPWSIETVRERTTRSMRDYFPHIFGKEWEKAAEIYQTHFRAIHLERLEALPGAEKLLQWLHTKPVHLAVASNKRGVNLRKETAHIGWDKYFHKVIGANDTPHDKPAPEPVYAALEGSGVKAGDEVWFIGDTDIDMQCAHTAGCVPVWYGEVLHHSGHYPFSVRVENHATLLNLLDKILK